MRFTVLLQDANFVGFKIKILEKIFFKSQKTNKKLKGLRTAFYISCISQSTSDQQLRQTMLSIKTLVSSQSHTCI